RERAITATETTPPRWPASISALAGSASTRSSARSWWAWSTGWRVRPPWLCSASRASRGPPPPRLPPPLWGRHHHGPVGHHRRHRRALRPHGTALHLSPSFAGLHGGSAERGLRPVPRLPDRVHRRALHRRVSLDAPVTEVDYLCPGSPFLPLGRNSPVVR